MRRMTLLVIIFALTASLGRAQDAATQQQLDKLSGQIQDLTEAKAQQGKRLDTLEKEINDLSDKLNQPAVNNSASVDDLKKLAEQVQDIDQKRQDDRKLILDQLEKLAKGTASGSGHHPTYNPPPETDNDNSTPAPEANVPQNG